MVSFSTTRFGIDIESSAKVLADNFGSEFGNLDLDHKPALYLINSIGILIGDAHLVDVTAYPSARVFRKTEANDFEEEKVADFASAAVRDGETEYLVRDKFAESTALAVCFT